MADLLVACVENDIRDGPEWTVAPRLKLDVEQLRGPTHLGAGDVGAAQGFPSEDGISRTFRVETPWTYISQLQDGMAILRTFSLRTPFSSDCG